MNNRLKSTKLIASTLVFVSCLFTVNSARADEYDCFEGCKNSLEKSDICKENVDYTINIDKNESSDVVVLSFHGGKIERHTSDISKKLADDNSWSRYDFEAHAGDDCLKAPKEKKPTNFNSLHISSQHFNDPRAIELVKSRSKSVSIHGYSPIGNTANNAEKKFGESGVGVICVGGSNHTQRQAFIEYFNKEESEFSKYDLIPIDAPNAGDGEVCDGIGGTKKKNLVNRNNSGEGGLQLELSSQMRKDLVKKCSDDDEECSYNKLRNIVYKAIEKAMEE